jgi:hypothetical protein
VQVRQPNGIDFWRGFALVSIFVNHVPGLWWEQFTHRSIGLSDSAELFVFLAGWSVRGFAANPNDPLTLVRTTLRVGARGVTLYAAQTVITLLAIGLLAGAAIVLQNPLLLEWHNAAAVFQDPVSTHLGLVMLTHQLGYFDILPLYIVLMFGAILMALCHRIAPWLLLPASIALYLAAIVYQFNLPTWPVEGYWFFNPFCWQLIFVLGFVLAGNDGLGGLVRRHERRVFALGVAGVVLGAWVAFQEFEPDPMLLPEPFLLFTFSKTFLSPMRLIHALCLFAACAPLFALIYPHIPRIAAYFCLLGRNSLYVFCVGSIASLAGQLARFVFGGNLATDTVILVSGVIVLGVTAWLSELKDRLRSARP